MPVRYGSAAVLVCALLTASIVADPVKKPATFAAVLKANFDRWDANHDGVLSPEEIDRLVTNPAVKGEEAAAVAALHHGQRGKARARQPLTEAFLLAPVRSNHEAPGRRDVAETHPNFPSLYASYLRHINRVPHELFRGDAPSLESFHQGRLGDCYFLAAVGAAVSRSPAAVRHTMHPRPDGSCDLVLPLHRIHVPRLTDAEIALGSTAGSQGLWLNALEKGFGLARQQRHALRPHEPATDAIDHGGDARVSIEFLTGHRAEYLSLHHVAHHGRGLAAHAPPVVRAREVLLAATAQRLLVCCGTSKEPKPAPGIATNHEYAVLGFDAAADTVHVWNPWGNHFEPKGPAGLEHGYPTQGGHFRVPLHDFVRIFSGISYETRLPVMHRR